jgi:hypothetical protein
MDLRGFTASPRIGRAGRTVDRFVLIRRSTSAMESGRICGPSHKGTLDSLRGAYGNALNHSSIDPMRGAERGRAGCADMGCSRVHENFRLLSEDVGGPVTAFPTRYLWYRPFASGPATCGAFVHSSGALTTPGTSAQSSCNLAARLCADE